MSTLWGKSIRGWLAVASLGILCTVAWGQDATPEVKRVAVPKVADQEAARKLLLELFRADAEQAKKPDEKLALAEKMLQVGSETNDDPVGQYMLFQLAKELAVSTLNAETALRAVDAQGMHFEIDAPDAKLATVATIEKALKFSKDRQALLLVLDQLVEDLIQSERYDLAKKATALTLDVARKVPDASAVKGAGVRLKEIETREKLFGEVQAARKVLETNPDDPAGNTTVGRFLCLINGEWDAGLPLLAKSGDAKLKAAAEKELAQPQESAQQMAVADLWWDISEKESGLTQAVLQQRAAAWYDSAMPGLSGLAKLKVTGRLEKFAKQGSAAKVATKPGKQPLTSKTGPTQKLVSNSIGMQLVLIPAGTFMMGSPPEEEGRNDEETQHRVKLTKPFYMGMTEVTKAQWKAVMQTQPWEGQQHATVEDDDPANYIGWSEAVEYCRKLSDKEKKTYRLPTEAEWEYACRAGTTTRFCFGEDTTEARKYVTPPSANGPVNRVGQTLPNPAGLFDMHGNVQEWCSDWKENYPSGDAVDPQGPKTGIYRVLRGGFNGTLGTAYNNCRSAKRGFSSGSSISYRHGFRVVLDTSPPAASNQAQVPESSPASPGAPKPPTAVASNQPRSPVSSTPGAKQPKTITNSIGMKLVEIPAGTFIMGSPEEERNRRPNEIQHAVKITRPFYLGQMEVTQKEWIVVMGMKPWEGQKEVNEGDDLAASYISWEAAAEFCKRLSVKERKSYRLPTEAEWEYAYRAGTTTSFYFGEGVGGLSSHTWFQGNAGPKYNQAVGGKLPNPWGLHDMGGNLTEWCWDWMGDYPSSGVVDPRGPLEGRQRIARGGSFFQDSQYLRAACRNSFDPQFPNRTIGFRVVCEIPSSGAPKPGMRAPSISSTPKPATTVASNTPKTPVAPAPAAKQFKITTNSIGMKLVMIPAGTFTMGSPEDELERGPTETQHKVTITKPFYMGVTEVTQAQWAAVMDHKPFDPPQKNSRLPAGANYPAGELMWDEAVDFCRKLSAKEGKTYRLPTEAEWEYACRAGTTTRFYFGDDEKQLNDFSWYRKSLSTANDYADYHIQHVGLKRPNAAGLYDMAGNVCEFCSDWWGPYAADAQTDPHGPDSGTNRVVRSCHYNDFVKDCRSAKRDEKFTKTRNSVFGFRVVLEVGAPTVPNAPKPASSPTGHSAPKPSTAVASNQPRSPVSSAPGAKQPKTITNTLGMKFVELPAGTFMMGSPEEEQDHKPDEILHKVTLTKPFYLATTEVTQAQWVAVMQTQPWEGKEHVGEDLDCAATYISWNDATEFCRILSEKEKKTYRLPTEAEWEYACRAGTKTAYHFGDDWRQSFHNYGWNMLMHNSGMFARPVGQKQPNAAGLYDMHGNASEWCADFMEPYPDHGLTDPRGPERGSPVVRGGEWDYGPPDCRSARRRSVQATARTHGIGFRVVCEQ